MAVTINRICGFETGDETELSANSGSTVGALRIRSGSFALNLSSTDTASIDPFAAQVTDQGNDYIIGLGVLFSDKTPASPTDFFICSDGSGANHIRLRIESDGDLVIVDANNSVVRTITDPFTEDVYSYLELYWQRSGTGTVELFIDGTSQGSDASQDLLSGTAAFTSCDFAGAGPGIWGTDDFYCISGATASSDRLSNTTGAAPFFEVFGYQSDKASATPDDGGANLQVGQWVDCGVVPFVTSTVAEYTSSNAGAVDSDATNGNPEGPLNDSRITGTIACIQGVWLMDRSGGGGSNHFGLLGNDTDGTTQSADFDPPASPPTGFFFLSESATIVPETTEYCRIGFETSGAQDFECYGQMAMLAHIPAAAAFTADLTTASFAMTAQSLDIEAAFDVDLTAASFAMVAQDLDVQMTFTAELTTASFAMTALDLDIPIVFAANLTAPEFAMTALDITLLTEFFAELTTASFGMTAQDVDVSVGVNIDLTTPEFAMTAQDITFINPFTAELTTALFPMTPQDLNVNAESFIDLTVASFAMTAQDLEVIVEGGIELSAASFPMTAQDISIPDEEVIELSVPEFSMTGRTLFVEGGPVARTQQGKRQLAFRIISGQFDNTYDGDIMLACLLDEPGIQGDTFNGVLYEWLGLKGFTDATLSGRMQQFAEAGGAFNWSSLGDFTI